MEHIFILGGTGFVGSHVCEKLARAGHRITVATRRRTHARHLMHLPTVTVLELDVHDQASLTRALAGHSVVINLVAILHGTEAAFERVHVALPRTLVAACKAAGGMRLVHVSALGANPQAPQTLPSRYLRSKSAGEALLLASGLPLAVLRPSVIFGAQDQFLNVFARLQRIAPVVPLAGAHARFQPVWVEDVAQAIVVLVERGLRSGAAQVLEACGPDVWTLQALVQRSGQWAGVRGGRGRPVLPLPDWAAYLQATLMECLPGKPLMSRDNVDSMRVANVASGTVPGLEALGLRVAALEPIARGYLSRFASSDA